MAGRITKDDNFKKYKNIIASIKEMEKSDEKGNPWFTDNYQCVAFDELKKTFPNVSFSKEDLFKIKKIWKDKEKNDALEQKKDSVDAKWENAINRFFKTCEILNGDKDLNSCNIEQEAFQIICDYKYDLRPRNPLYNNYFNTFKKYDEAISNNEKLLHSNINIERRLNEEINKNNELTKNNKKLNTENSSLKENVSNLKKALDKTLDFCNEVKESKLGKFLFRKQLNTLPNSEIEKI